MYKLKLSLLQRIIFVILLSFCSNESNAQYSSNNIIKVIFNGLQRVEDGVLRDKIQTRQGAIFDEVKLNEDLKTIYKLGYFDRVNSSFDFVNSNLGEGVQVVFDLKERPPLKNLNVEGNSVLSKEDIEKLLDSDAKKFFGRSKANELILKIKKAYEVKGYEATSVKAEIKTLTSGSINCDLKIDEGKRSEIGVISFSGNNNFDDSDLLEEIDSREYSWLTSWVTGRGVLIKDLLDADVKKLQNFYYNNGYVDVVIGDPRVSEVEGEYKVLFPIKEGNQYKLGAITASGTLDESISKTVSRAKLKKGDIFSSEKIREDSYKIADHYTDNGFAFANVVPLTRVNKDSKTIDLDYKVEKGDLTKIGRIDIVGNSKTNDNVIRRNLKIQEEQLFSSSKLKRSQELLNRLGFFDEVSITPEQTKQTDKIDMKVRVKEANTGAFTIGAGVAAGDGFILNSRINENNLFGTGNRLGFEVDTGTRRNDYMIDFVNPRVNDSLWSMGVDGQSVRRVFDGFDRDELGGGFNFGYPILSFLGDEFEDDVRATVSYGYSTNSFKDIQADAPQKVRDQDSLGNINISSITPRIVRDTIDNPLFPTTGSRQNLSVEYSGLGSNYDFYVGRVQNAWYYPLIDTSLGPIVFSQRFKLGYGDSIGNQTDKAGSEVDFGLPVFRRFFLGGIDSIRGYDARRVGPKDAGSRNSYGGSKQIVGNFELIAPISKGTGLSVVSFYDAGNAFDDNENLSLSNLRQAVGFGIRWRSPIAPIRLEFGIPLDKEEGDKSFVTNFSIGAPF